MNTKTLPIQQRNIYFKEGFMNPSKVNKQQQMVDLTRSGLNPISEIRKLPHSDSPSFKLHL